MMQTLIVAVIVLAAAVHVARALLPRRWLRRSGSRPSDTGSCGSCRK